MMKCKLWKGEDLEGVWEVTFKLDGVRAFSDGKKIISRNGKPLYNLDHLAHLFEDAEVFLGDFKSTIEAVRTKKEAKEVKPEHIYTLYPKADPRLSYCSVIIDPLAEEIKKLFDGAIEMGYEGLVLKKYNSDAKGKLTLSDRWLKVKAFETYDVPCLEFVIGKGKYSNTLGYAITPMGRVGGGFKDNERDWFWKEKPTGLVIEVECNRLTESGIFRHARFKRIRWDKS